MKRGINSFLLVRKDPPNRSGYLKFRFSCSVAGNNRVGLKTFNVGTQILGQVEMKGIYFHQNALFISACKTSGEPLPPQAGPTSLTCGVCGYLCDGVAKLSVFTFSFVMWEKQLPNLVVFISRS